MAVHQKHAVIVGNWKMYKNLQETEEFIKELAPTLSDAPPVVILCVPFTAIRTAVEAASGTPIQIGAQNMNDVSEGAFTGEIAASMLLEAGARFVILGHSERRQIFKESDAFINKKMKRALSENLTPILCIGETLKQREEGNTYEVLKQQLTQCLADISPQDVARTLIAYEPVWAINTGKTATPEQAQEAHLFCRETIHFLYGEEAAAVPILYGGSVKPNNAHLLMEQPDVDGLLVGGASLTVESFSRIVNYQKALTH